MKYKILVVMLSAALVSACNKNPESIGTQVDTPELQTPMLEKSLIPVGRWFHNPLHCENKFPLNGPYDFTINETGISYLGIQNSGRWLALNESNQTFAQLNKFIESKRECISAKPDQFVYLKYDSKGIDYTLVHDPESSLLFRVNDDAVQLLVPFDKEKISKLAIVEEEAELLPDAFSTQDSAF